MKRTTTTLMSSWRIGIEHSLPQSSHRPEVPGGLFLVHVAEGGITQPCLTLCHSSPGAKPRESLPCFAEAPSEAEGEAEGNPLLTLLVWSGHSCPLPLTLLLILN